MRTRAWLRDLLAALLPGACALCGRPRPERALCARCAAGLPRLDAPLPPAPPPLAAWWAAVPFAGSWALLLRRFKYPARSLGGLDPAAEAVATELIRDAAGRVPPPLPAAVLAVPQHRSRRLARGLHPAAVLAAAAARSRGLPLAATALVRLRDTPSQTGLSASARRRNVAGAFAARRPLPARVWLVDDVLTTGATLAEAARAARRAGAREVVAVCAAATPREVGHGPGGGPGVASADGPR